MFRFGGEEVVSRVVRGRWMKLYLAVGALLVAGLWIFSAFFVGPHIDRFTTNCSIVEMDLHALHEMLERFARDHEGRFATGLEELLPGRSDDKGYLVGRTDVPRDPWKHPYLLAVAAEESWFLVGSLGRDGRLGGKGDDADLWLDSRETR